MFYADSCCFVNRRGKSPIAKDDLMLNFGIVTATPPTLPSENGKGGRPLSMKETLDKTKEFKDVIASQSRLRLVLSRSDLTNAIANKQVGIVLGLQNAPADANPKALFDVGIRIMSLAYYEENDLGSGFLNGGLKLKKFGEEVIIKCAESGIIIDLSHVGHQTALDTLSFIKKNRLNCRIMASHGGCAARYHHPRNILDETMRGIVDLGGVVGITTITFNLDEEKNNAGPFIRHLSHAIKVCGEKNVCIGTDSVYAKRTPGEAEEGIKMLRPWLDPLDIQGIRYPENICEGPDLMEKIYTALTLPGDPLFGGFTDFSDSVTEGVMGKNLLNFFERALPE